MILNFTILYILTRLDISRIEAIFRENLTRRQVDPRDFMAEPFYDAQIETGRKKRVGTRVPSLYLSLRFSVGQIYFVCTSGRILTAEKAVTGRAVCLIRKHST